jgi:hypothetical protein
MKPDKECVINIVLFSLLVSCMFLFMLALKYGRNIP